MENIAKRNIKIHGYVNMLSGAVFLLPVITLLYKYTGLGLFEIVLISNVMNFSLWLFELPTSVLADTLGRKKSMIYSVSANALSALMILLWPTFWGFVVAAVFRALYYSFWSGTGQAFLDENLHILGKQAHFGRVIGRFMAYEQAVALATPLVASGILRWLGDDGYMVLAGMDVVFAVLLIFLVLGFKEVSVYKKLKGFGRIFRANLDMAKTGLKNVFLNSNIRLILIYRSLSHHLTFLSVILLPTLAVNGMSDWMAGVVITLTGVFVLVSTKFAYKIGEKYSYNSLWVWSSVAQGILIVLAGLFLKSWIVLAGLFVLIEFFFGFCGPSWNHILIEQSRGKAIATTRSIVMAVFALYITVGKQVLSFFDPEYALIGVGVFILFVNLVLGRRVIRKVRTSSLG